LGSNQAGRRPYTWRTFAGQRSPGSWTRWWRLRLRTFRRLRLHCCYRNLSPRRAGGPGLSLSMVPAWMLLRSSPGFLQGLSFSAPGPRILRPLTRCGCSRTSPSWSRTASSGGRPGKRAVALGETRATPTSGRCRAPAVAALHTRSGLRKPRQERSRLNQGPPYGCRLGWGRILIGVRPGLRLSLVGSWPRTRYWRAHRAEVRRWRSSPLVPESAGDLLTCTLAATTGTVTPFGGISSRSAGTAMRSAAADATWRS